MSLNLVQEDGTSKILQEDGTSAILWSKIYVVALAGFSATVSQGSLGSTESFALTGSSATAAKGSLAGSGAGTQYLLQETGFHILMEDGSNLLLSPSASATIALTGRSVTVALGVPLMTIIPPALVGTVMTTASGLMAFEIDAFPISPLPLTVSLGAITFTVVSSPPLLFPDILGQTYERMPVYLALLSSGTTANDQRRRFEQHDNLFNYKLGWTALSTTQAWALNDVVQNCSGGWRLVVFFEWPATQSVGVTLGTGTGAEQEFTLPSAYTTGITPYIDGVAKTFTLDPLSGINGEDRIIFALADVPAGGSVVTADFTGRRRRTVRIGPFEMDDISAGDFRWQVSLELYGMREPNTWPFSLT